MTGYLLDTNVVSELSRAIPDQAVVDFLSEQEDLWISVILIHEIEYGLQLLPQGRRRNRLSELQASILETFTDRILPLDRAGAEWSAEFRAQARYAGRTVDVVDALLAGIAKSHSLTVPTRNTALFSHLDVDVVDPWESSH